MNKVILTGNLCKDNELKKTGTDTAYLQNTIAVRSSYKNDKGEYESDFVNITAWRNTAEFMSKYTSKGSRIMVEGRIQVRNYDAEDGTKKYITSVVAEKVELIGAKKENQEVNEPDLEQEMPF